MREEVLPQRGDHALTGGREQVHLHEVHRALQQEQQDQAERDSVEQCAVALLERRVEQVPHDLWEREADAGRNEQTGGRDHQPSRVLTDARQQPGEHAWGGYAPGRYSRGGRRRRRGGDRRSRNHGCPNTAD
jgi:hypothetical protein